MFEDLLCLYPFFSYLCQLCIFPVRVVFSEVFSIMSVWIFFSLFLCSFVLCLSFSSSLLVSSLHSSSALVSCLKNACMTNVHMTSPHDNHDHDHDNDHSHDTTTRVGALVSHHPG